MKNKDINTKNYWTQRYIDEKTGWDIGYPSTPLKTYFNQLENKALRILIPGAGNGYEAEYLLSKGFSNVFVMDVSELPLLDFKKRNPDFPEAQLILGDFFKHKNKYDLIIEQTFFCSFPPLQKTRKEYAKQMNGLLNKNGKLVGLWFNITLTGDLEKRPFGGDKAIYLSYLEPYFNTIIFEKCYNSIESRKDNELFGIFIKA